MNQKGQAMIEALIAGTLSLFGLYLLFVYGMRIIQTTLQMEQQEERTLCQIMRKNECP